MSRALVSSLLFVSVACGGAEGGPGGPGGDGGGALDGGFVWDADVAPDDAGFPPLDPAMLVSDRVAGAGIGGAPYEEHGCATGVAPAGYTLRYVAAGASPGGDGSRATPYASLVDATEDVDHVVVCVASGTYTGNVDLGTYAHARVVGGFDATFAQRDPRTAPTRVVASPATASAIIATAPRDVVLDGLEVTGSAKRGIELHSWGVDESVRIVRCHVHHNGSTTFDDDQPGGIAVGGGSDTTIEIAYSVIEENDGWHHGAGIHIGSDTIDPIVRDGANDGFGSIASFAPGLASIHHVIVRRNRLHEPSLPHGAGIAIGMNADVHHVDVRENDTVGVDHYGVGGGLIAQHGTSADDDVAVVVVRQSWFEGNRADKAGSALFFDQTSIGYVLDSVIVRNIGEGAVLVDGSCGDTCSGPGGNHDRNFVTLVHDTIADNDGAGLVVQDSTAHLYFNLFWHNASAVGDVVTRVGGGAAPIVRGADNVIVTSSGAFPELVRSTDGEALALFVDAAARDYRLVTGDATEALYVTSGALAPAFVFTGALYVAGASPVDFLDVARPSASGRAYLGAFAARVGP